MRRPPSLATLRRRRRQRRRGAATVEFALTCSIVFFMFLGMIEVSRFHVVRYSIDQAVYMGARTGIVPGATVEEVDAAVRDRLAQAGVVNPTITVSPSAITSETSEVTVRVSVPYSDNTWTVPKYFGEMNVVAEMTLDHENVAFN